jgi:hypothetical protein
MDGTYSKGVWNEKCIPSGEMTTWYTKRRWKDIIQVAAIVIKSSRYVLSVVSNWPQLILQSQNYTLEWKLDR